MRVALGPDSALERAGLALGKVPKPAAYTFGGMAVARILGVAQRLGIFAALAGEPLDAEALAARLGLATSPTRMALDVLVGERVLARQGDRYVLGPDGRPWLDPSSPTYIGTYIEHTVDYWTWWGEIEGVLRGGDPIAIHSLSPGDPGWETYIRGQYELARLSATAVAKAIPLRGDHSSVLDLGGGHGLFAASVCRRHQGMRATIIDLPGSVAVGRKIAAEAGFADVVTFVEGDMFAADLGGAHDAVLCCSILHHFGEDQIRSLLTRVRGALRPGGVLAVLDLFHDEGQPTSSAAIFELFFNLTSGMDTLTEEALSTALVGSGFSRPRRRTLRAIPDLRLYTAEAG
ncbi:MAG: methyltransferase [Acidimicrobiales bacterium]